MVARSLRARRGRLGGERCELLAAGGRAGETPAALCGLGKDDPRATSLCRVAGDLGHDLGDLSDELLLACSGERRRRRDDLDPHGAGGVGGCGVNRVRVHQVDESGGVVQVEGAGGGHTLGPEDGHRKLLAKETGGPCQEKVCRSIYINHGHWEAPAREGQPRIYVNRWETHQFRGAIVVVFRLTWTGGSK